MKIYSIPKNLNCIIFDIDSTLYTHEIYAKEQIDVQIKEFASLMQMSLKDAHEAIDTFKEEHLRVHGKKLSLANTLEYFGIPISESIRWRENLIEPARFLSKDKKLIDCLQKLAKKFRLAALTNNSIIPGKKNLEALGVQDFFPILVGLDTTGESKPHPKTFTTVLDRVGEKAETCISIGDRYDIDIAYPLSIGMGGILVDGVSDVYQLPEILY